MTVIRNSTYWNLVQALRNERVVAFIGAGVSKSVLGMPTWKEVLETLLDKTPAKAGVETPTFKLMLAGLRASAKEDGLFTAEQCRKYLKPDGFADTLVDLFGGDRKVSPRPMRSLSRLLGLPLKRIVTTNYDDLLLKASIGVEHVEAITHEDVDDFDAFVRNADTPSRRTVLHLHGRLGGRGRAGGVQTYPLPGKARREWIRTIVLSELQYQDLYRRREVVELMETIFSTHSALFVGFSLEDDDVMSIFRDVLARFPSPRERHFALIPRVTTTPESWLRSVRSNYRHGIGLIEFEPGSDFGGLWDLTDALCDECELRRTRDDHAALARARIDIAVDRGFTYTRNLLEVVELLNELQSTVHYRVCLDTGIDLREGFDGTGASGEMDEQLGRARSWRDLPENEVDGVFAVTDKNERGNFMFADKGFGGFISTSYWSELKPPGDASVRPSVDEYLQHTLALLTVHFFDHLYNWDPTTRTKCVESHEPDVGCIFDHTVQLRRRIAAIDLPMLCDECFPRLERAFRDQPVDVGVDWLRRVVPFLE